MRTRLMMAAALAVAATPTSQLVVAPRQQRGGLEQFQRRLERLEESVLGFKRTSSMALAPALLQRVEALERQARQTASSLRELDRLAPTIERLKDQLRRSDTDRAKLQRLRLRVGQLARRLDALQRRLERLERRRI